MNQSGKKEEFKKRVYLWAKKIEAEISVISIRSMKNKWASYTKSSKLLIFNSELLDMDENLCDYVIVHELLHSHVPNHGKLWKSLMHAHLGDYEKLEKPLRNLSKSVRDI